MSIGTVLLDFLFPPRANEKLLRPVTTLPVRHHAYADIFCLTHFSQSVVSAALTENKFHNNAHARRLAAGLLETWLKTLTDPTYIIAVPLGKKRQKERGYNQVSVLLNDTQTNYTELKNAVTRVTETKPQTTCNRQERLQNVVGAFRVTDQNRLAALRNCRLLLLDDVTTTGSTLTELKNTIQPYVDRTVTVQKVALAH